MKKEINKKIILLSLVLFSIILISLVAVYAQNEPVAATTGQNNLDKLAKWVSEQIENSTWGIDAAKATPWFLGVLLWIVLYSVLIKTGLFARSTGELGIGAALVALIVTILAFLYTPADFWTSIAVQYSVLGAAILTLIPFLIMFYFTAAVSENLLMSYLFWIVYVIYYFLAFFYKILMSDKGLSAPENLPYLIAIIGGVLVLSFLAVIRKWFWKEELLSKRETGMRKIQKAKTGADILGSAADTFSKK